MKTASEGNAPTGSATHHHRPSLLRLEGQVALVTGAGQGMGREIALRLAAEGADVAINDIRGEPARCVAAEIEALGRRSLPLVGDVSDPAAVQGVFEDLLASFDRLDILVNNAGIGGPIKPLLDCTDQEWDGVFDVNARGVFLCSQAAARQMIRQGSGRIINAGSLGGLRAVGGFVPYCASKFAVIGLTQGLALELAPYGITVNTYCPGIIDTEMAANTHERLADEAGISLEEMVRQRVQRIPLGRMGAADDVADIVVFLASDEARYITGQSMQVCGGLLMR